MTLVVRVLGVELLRLDLHDDPDPEPEPGDVPFGFTAGGDHAAPR